MKRLKIAAAAVCLAAGALTIGGASGGQAAPPAYKCFGQAATIVGTAGDDLLVGREDTADVIVGLGGDDIIFGAEDVNASTAPGDRLCGGPGGDYVKGGVGQDRIQGGGGPDNVDGSFLLDVITLGGRGNDIVADCDSEYSGGVRELRGGPGNDRLCTDWDSTLMYGGSGRDVLQDFTCRFESTLHGGPGDDVIESYEDSFDGVLCSEFSGAARDLVGGGVGSDSAVVDRADRRSSVEVVRIR